MPTAERSGTAATGPIPGVASLARAAVALGGTALLVASPVRAFAPEPGSAAERAERLRAELQRAPHDFRDVMERLTDAFFARLPGAIAGIALVVVFWFLSRLAARIVAGLMRRTKADAEARDLLLPLVRIGVFGLGCLMALDQMGFQVGSLLAGVGIAGLAVGLAAQETLANLFAGFSLLWDRPFGHGDTVTVAGIQGEVLEIGLRSTRLRTPENREAILPNKLVLQQPVVNHTRFAEFRVVAAATVAHGASVEAAREAILAAIAARFPHAAAPRPEVLVTALGDLGTTLETRVFVSRAGSDGREAQRLLETVETALAAADVERARVPPVSAGPLASAPSRPPA